MNRLIISINQDAPISISDFFQKKYFGKELCYQVPSDLTLAEIDYLCNFLSENILSEIKKITGINVLNTSHPKNIFTFKVAKINGKTDSCSDLSIYYQYNDWVVIRNGIYDQSLNQKIGNFKGKIVDFFNDGEQDVYFIKFEINSLSQIPEKKILNLIQQGISPFDTYINSNQILPFRNPFSKNDLSNLHMEFFLKFAHKNYSLYWYDSENELLQNAQLPIVINWEKHFQKIFNDHKAIKALNYHNEIIKINGTAGSDEKNGVWISIDSNGQGLIIPLADVKRITTPDFSKNDLKIYQYWASFFCQ